MRKPIKDNDIYRFGIAETSLSRIMSRYIALCYQTYMVKSSDAGKAKTPPLRAEQFEYLNYTQDKI